MEIYTIIFIGPQGSGKGTQIQKLNEVLETNDSRRRVVDIQTGRRFRALAEKRETFAERKVARTLNDGGLQPDFLTAVLWGQAMIDQLDPKSHLLIDGFPRTIHQAEALEDALEFFERGELSVVNFEIPEDVVRARMKNRARPDDTPESIEERLRWYRDDTVSVIEYYRKREGTTVYDIDATKSIEEVHKAILTALALP